MSKHSIVHIEISSKDRETDAQFYQSVFGWEIRQIPEMNYATFQDPSGHGGGLNPLSEDNPPGTIIIYIETDDIQQTIKEIEAAGGKLLTQPMDIPSVGAFALFADLTGNKLALLQPLPGM